MNVWLTPDMLDTYCAIYTIIYMNMLFCYFRDKNINLKFNYNPASTNAATCLPVEYSYTFTADSKREEVCALIVLIMVYGLIIFDVSCCHSYVIYV